MGRVKSLRDGRIMKGGNTNGYKAVSLRRYGLQENKTVHRLVLEAFVGPCPEGMQTRHYPDPDKTNNKLSNLSWSTQSRNIRDNVDWGIHTDNRGEKHGMSRLTEDVVQKILAAEGTVTSLAKIFNIAPGWVSMIKHRKAWGHIVPKKYVALKPYRVTKDEAYYAKRREKNRLWSLKNKEKMQEYRRAWQIRQLEKV
jgi:hypothetical protein